MSEPIYPGVTVLIDMDGVVTDFVRPAARLFGTEFADLVESGRWAPGTFDMYEALGVGRSDFYGTLDAAGGQFWRELPAYPWARRLLDLARRLAATYFCTAPILHPECAGAKIEWLRAFTGNPRYNDYVVTKHKQLLANRRTVLVDDSDANVDAFREAGGLAVQVPAHWNRRHRLLADGVVPLAVVALELEHAVTLAAGQAAGVTGAVA